MSDEKNIYTLKLNESVKIDHFTEVTRVPNGWIYSIYTDYSSHEGIYNISSVFVPYSEEFKNEPHN